MSRKSNFARKARQAKRRRQSSVMVEERPKVENTCVSKVEDTCVSIDQARENLAAKLRQSALALHDNGKPRIDFERVCKLSRADWEPLDTPDKIYFDYFWEGSCRGGLLVYNPVTGKYVAATGGLTERDPGIPGACLFYERMETRAGFLL